MGIDTGSYSYNISASADNTAYLWSGHGLTDAENPTLYFRDGDIVTISKIGGGHPLKISNDADQSFVLESGGVLLLEPIEEGTYTYVCTSHAAMTGKILVGARYQGEGPDEGFGTGLLPTRNSPISVNQIRTKINEIITKGGVGGGKVTVSESPPDFPSEGNLWYDSSFAALFAYLEDYGWVQTNGALGRAQAVIVNSSEPSDALEKTIFGLIPLIMFLKFIFLAHGTLQLRLPKPLLREEIILEPQSMFPRLNPLTPRVVICGLIRVIHL